MRWFAFMVRSYQRPAETWCRCGVYAFSGFGDMRDQEMAQSRVLRSVDRATNRWRARVPQPKLTIPRFRVRSFFLNMLQETVE